MGGRPGEGGGGGVAALAAAALAGVRCPLATTLITLTTLTTLTTTTLDRPTATALATQPSVRKGASAAVARRGCGVSADGAAIATAPPGVGSAHLVGGCGARRGRKKSGRQLQVTLS